MNREEEDERTSSPVHTDEKAKEALLKTEPEQALEPVPAFDVKLSTNLNKDKGEGEASDSIKQLVGLLEIERDKIMRETDMNNKDCQTLDHQLPEMLITDDINNDDLHNSQYN